MNESATYSVVLSGNLKSGFELDWVIDSFARLFKVPPEKASCIIGTEFVVKRDVELQVAKTYKEKLSCIGVEVLLKRDGGIEELALEPVHSPAAADDAESAPPSAAEMLCPKCALKQPKAEECRGCGVIIARVLQLATPSADAEIVSQVVEPAHGEEVADTRAVTEDQPTGMKWIIAPLVVAVLGALLWYFIAINLEFEYGLIAWLIGAAVGFVSLSSGAQGNATGAVCALLVVGSICGGKYMIVASGQSDLAEQLSSSIEYEGIVLQEFYQEELGDASEFSKLPGDDASLRRFMVAHDYSDSPDAAQVTDEEVAQFVEYTAPRLQDIALNRPSFEEWREYNLSDTIRDLSTFELMIDSLDWMDMLFFFFGVATAYRLASQGRSS
jgi:hypothetical protein